MWCIAALTKEYRQRMYHLLALYQRPLRSDEPVVCIDEKSLQLLAHSRTPMPMKPGRLRKEDYEYATHVMHLNETSRHGRGDATSSASRSSGASLDTGLTQI